jgi:hypothetical protein
MMTKPDGNIQVSVMIQAIKNLLDWNDRILSTRYVCFSFKVRNEYDSKQKQTP